MPWPFDKQKQSDNPDPEAEKKAADAALEQFKAAVAEATKPLQDELSALKGRLDTLEVKPDKKDDKQPDPEERKGPRSVFEDEDAAFNERLTPLLQLQLKTQSRLVLQEVAREYGDAWSTFSKDIEETLAKSPIQFTADPAYVRNVADMVIGREARKNGFKFNSETKAFFLEPAGGSDKDSGKTEPSSSLTAKQRRVFERMGVPLDKAEDTVKKLEFVS